MSRSSYLIALEHIGAIKLDHQKIYPWHRRILPATVAALGGAMWVVSICGLPYGPYVRGLSGLIGTCVLIGGIYWGEKKYAQAIDAIDSEEIKFYITWMDTDGQDG